MSGSDGVLCIGQLLAIRLCPAGWVDETPVSRDRLQTVPLLITAAIVSNQSALLHSARNTKQLSDAAIQGLKQDNK